MSDLAVAWARSPLMSFINHRAQLTFYRQLHAMIRSGIPLPTALADLAKYAPSAALRRALPQLNLDLAQGATLSDALSKHQTLFDTSHLELLAFAEHAGKMEPILDALINHLQQVHALRWKAILTSLYPLYLVGAFIFVGPLLDVARSANAGTSIGAAYLAGLVRNLFIGALVVAVVLGFPLLVAALDAELWFDGLKRRLPVIGPALEQLMASQFVMTLGLAVGAGVDMPRALSLSARAPGNRSLEAALPRALDTLRRGSSLVDAVGVLSLLDRPSLGTLAVAEKTGTLERALKSLSDELQESALRAIRIIIVATIVVFAGLVLVFIVQGLLGVIMGPVKTLYDAAGTGSLDSR